MAVVGLTSTLKNYNVAGAFLASETTESYAWGVAQLAKLFVQVGCQPSCIVTDRELALMHACESLFPTTQFLLCRRHVKKNIEDYAIKAASSKLHGTQLANAYYGLFKQTTLFDYERRLGLIKHEWRNYQKVHDYVEKRWLGPFKQRIVSAWTDLYFNLGQNTTNRYILKFSFNTLNRGLYCDS